MEEIKDVEIVLEDSANETKVPLIFQAVLEFVLGIFLIVYQDKTNDILFIVIGALMTGYGVFGLISFMMNSSKAAFRMGLGSPVLITIVGLAFIVQSHNLSNLLSIMLGALIIIESIVNCRRAMIIKRLGFYKWYIPFAASLAILALGVFISIFPNLFGEIISVIIGIAIIFESIVDFWSIHRMHILRKHVSAHFSTKDNSNSIIKK